MLGLQNSSKSIRGTTIEVINFPFFIYVYISSLTLVNVCTLSSDRIKCISSGISGENL